MSRDSNEPVTGCPEKAAQEKQKASEELEKSEKASESDTDAVAPAEDHLELTLEDDASDEKTTAREFPRGSW